MTIKEAIDAHPLPWRYVATAGNVEVLDAAGVVVPLFVLLDFLVATTAFLAKKGAPPSL